MNSPVDQALLKLVHQNVHSLKTEVKNWSEELKEEKERVQQQLQKFNLGLGEIKQRVLELETGHQGLETRMIQFEGTPDSLLRKKIIINENVEALKSNAF